MHIKKKIVKKLMPSPVKARHIHYSMLFSVDDDISTATDHLISLAVEAVRCAQKVSLEDIAKRMSGPPYYVNIWPGEHYRLLAGFVLALNPKLIIEIGTATGLSALSMKKYLSPDAKLATFDLIDWQGYPNSCLKNDDFKDGRIVQHTDDLSQSSGVAKHRNLLENADLIFIDAEKDGMMEQKFLDNFRDISFCRDPIIIFDDIRLWNMLKIWREISLPKLDLTSFGHWTGTGIVQWNNK